MDPEPSPASPLKPLEGRSEIATQAGDTKEVDDEDPLSLSGPYVAMSGLAIAIAAIWVPFAAVLTERPLEKERIVPTDLEIDGPKTAPSLSITRVGESSSGDTGWKSK